MEAIPIQCAACGKQGRVRAELAGRSVTCPACQERIPVPLPAPDTPLPSPKSAQRERPRAAPALPARVAKTKTTRPRSVPQATLPDLRPLVLATLIWIPLALLIARLGPGWSTASAAMQSLVAWMPLTVTLLLIAWHLVTAVRLVGLTGEVLDAWPTTIAQLLLFSLAFHQTMVHWGASEFEFEDGPPAGHAWVVMTGIHILRAADVFDLLEAWGYGIQSIHPAGHVSRALMTACHLIFGFFGLTLLAEFIEGVAAQFVRERAQLTIGAFLAAWLVTAVFVRPWRPIDLALWPADNLLRVLDFADVLNTYHIRMHQVPPALWEDSLGVAARVIIAVFAAYLLGETFLYLSTRYLGGFGLPVDDLQDHAVDAESEEVRRALGRRMKGILSNRNRVREELWSQCVNLKFLGTCAAVALGGGLLVWTLPDWSRTAAALAASVGGEVGEATAAPRPGLGEEPAIADLAAHFPQVARFSLRTGSHTQVDTGDAPFTADRAVRQVADWDTLCCTVDPQRVASGELDELAGLVAAHLEREHTYAGEIQIRVLRPTVPATVSLRAVQSLRKLGPFAHSVRWRLYQALPGVDDSLRPALMSALFAVFPLDENPLRLALRVRNDPWCDEILQATRGIGPASAAFLCSDWAAKDEAVQREVSTLIEGWGYDAADSLLHGLTRQDCKVQLEFLCRADENWHLRRARSPLARYAIECRIGLPAWKAKYPSMTASESTLIGGNLESFFTHGP